MFSKKRSAIFALVVVLVCGITLVSLSAKLYLPDGITYKFPEWRPRPTQVEAGADLPYEANETVLLAATRTTTPTATGTATSKVDEIVAPQVTETATPEVIEPVTPLSLEYYPVDDSDEICSRFSPAYFQDFHNHPATYCTPDSPAKLTCFHRYSGFEGKTDSFCYAQGATLDLTKEKFHLDCALRNFTEQEVFDGLLPFDRLPFYWYETGPAAIFATSIDVGLSKRSADESEVDYEEEAVDETEAEYQEEMVEPTNTTQPVVEVEPEEPVPTVKPPKTLLLLKREGEGNPWHSLMEIFSTFMTFDIMRMPGGVNGDQPPLFNDPTDSEDTQVVILDDRGHGPYFDLWTLYARREPIWLEDFLADKALVKSIDTVNLILPLTGSSNPFWKDDAATEQCTNSQTLNVFSRRVLDFYGIPSPSLRDPGTPMIVTWVWRRETRRMKYENALLAELAKRNPHISVRMVDFAVLSFAEQIRVAQESDVLVGIHGAGLTHSIFMRQGASAVVEIQPEEFDHRGFRNVAGMRNLGYFRTHATIIKQETWVAGEADPIVTMQPANATLPEKETKRNSRREQHRAMTAKRGIEKREEWHFNDIEIDENRFFDVVETAIKYMYAKGPWTMDVN